MADNDRAAKGGGTASTIPLPQSQQGVGQDAYRIQYQTRVGYSPGIVQNNGADWFGPLNPMQPVAPPEVEGRALDFPSGYNLEITPRPYDPVKFPEMRALADAYDVLRLVIETRKDQMERPTWSIKVRSDAQGKPAMDPEDEGLKAADQEITDFLQRPDGDHEWSTWLRSLLEDLFVIDAPALYCHRTRGGKLLALEQLDGATVKRVINDWGRTPDAPAPAYQQILKGFPAINYTRDQLLYMPRNVRVHKFYGYSPVEQAIMTVNIALRRQLFMLQYYTEGNIPEALVGTPDLWTPKQIKDFQDAFDGMLSGNLAYRRRIKFVPGGVAKTFIQTKEAELTGKMEEWLARVVCYCFSVSPQPFISMMNRATAETAHDAALEEGLAPIQNWVKRLIDRVILMFWPRWAKYLEFSWDDDREVDQQVQMEVLTGYVENGIMKANEAREVIGLDPDPSGDVLRVKTGTGMVTLDVNDDAPTAGEQHDAQQANQQLAIKAKAEAEANAKAGQPAKGKDGEQPSKPGAKGDGKEPPASNGDKQPAGDGKGPVDDGKGNKKPVGAGKDGGAAEKAAQTFLRKRGYWGTRVHARKGTHPH